MMYVTGISLLRAFPPGQVTVFFGRGEFMQPVTALWKSQADLMAADATKLAIATFLKLKLAVNNFVPSLGRVLADFTEATFTGYAAKTTTSAVHAVSYDALTGLYTITIAEPAGGWFWESAAVIGAPETVYGAYLVDAATELVLFGSQLLPVPVTIDAADQSISLQNVTFTFSPTYPN